MPTTTISFAAITASTSAMISAPTREILSRISGCTRLSARRMRGMLLADMLHQLPRTHLPAVHVPRRVHRHAFGGTRARHLQRVRDAVQHFPALQITDADAALPPRV